MTEDKIGKDVRAFVRAHYGEIAEQSILGTIASCCPTSSNCCDSKIETNDTPAHVLQLYEANISELPAEVTKLSLGCGDPVTLAALRPGQAVLDLGSGGGIDCFLAAKQVGPTGQVIGIDMTPAMIDQARNNKARLKADNVEFRLGEIEHLPVADESVDIILSNCVINLSPDKPQVFREALRVLKPGGKLAVSDIVTNGPLSSDLKRNLSAWAGCVAGALEVEEYVGAIKQAGFVDVQVEPVISNEIVTGEVIDDTGSKAAAEDSLEKKLKGVVFSARVTAVKPV